MNWNKVKLFRLWLLFIPVVGMFYLGLFITLQIWYPAGLPISEWRTHIWIFSIVYLFWIIIFYANRLFDLDSFQSFSTIVRRLAISLFMCGVAAILFFYSQPVFILTPRRFLLVHMIISGGIIGLWYLFAKKIFPYTSRSLVFAHPSLQNKMDLENLLNTYAFSTLKYRGIISGDKVEPELANSLVVFPRNQVNWDPEITENLFELRRLGVRFIAYHELYERVSRQVPLDALSEFWFIDYVDYGAHKIFDSLKRLIDLLFGLLGLLVFIVTAPIIATLIRLSSPGPILFKQQRVGKGGKVFTLYKYRTMTTTGASDTWTAAGDTRITGIGRILRICRLDEFPQSWNILKGDMSIVGPRPEQVNIVAQLREQIPYYDERHLVKPGLTGWAQLHVYASSLEETKRKLQYDLYYIKHRSLLFDSEIIIKTIYNIFTLDGR